MARSLRLRRRPCILLVHPRPGPLLAVRRDLRRAGFRTALAPDRGSALRYLREGGPADLAVAEVGRGAAPLEPFTAVRPGLRVLLLARWPPAGPSGRAARGRLVAEVRRILKGGAGSR